VLLEGRTKAIEHIRQAHDAINNNRLVSGEELANLREAKNSCELVFSPEVQEALAQAHSKARDLNSVATPDKRKERDFQDKLDGLGKELQVLLKQMNQEAALDR
jgi:hypothetical protein